MAVHVQRMHKGMENPFKLPSSYTQVQYGLNHLTMPTRFQNLIMKV
jgi:hypothetical protein